AFPMETDTNRDVVHSERGRGILRRERGFRSETMAAGRVHFAGGIPKGAEEFQLDGGTAFDQSDGYVHSFAATSLKISSGSVTSRKIEAISAPVIRAKSFSKGTTKIPQRSIDAGLTVNSPV